MTDSQVEKIYNDAVNRLRAIVNEVHNRYAVNGVLVPSNLTGRVTLKDMQLLKEQYDKLPDELTVPEKQRVKLYTAISQTSRRGLVTALLGFGLALATHKVAQILAKNNQRAAKEETDYQARQLDMSDKQHRQLESKAERRLKPDYRPAKTDITPVTWLDRLWLNHDQLLNRIDGSISKGLAQGMRAEDIANKLFPGNAQSMKEDNIPKVLRDASVAGKRLARSEAAMTEDNIAMEAFKQQDVKYVDWVTEPGSCALCNAIEQANPYKVEEAPKPVADSHPNCRCRKVPHVGLVKDIFSKFADRLKGKESRNEFNEKDNVAQINGDGDGTKPPRSKKQPEEPQPYSFLDLESNDPKVIKELTNRLDNVIAEYQQVSGVDIRQEINNDTFISRDGKHPYDDPKAKFLEWLYHKVGYDALPKEVKNFDDVKPFRDPTGVRLKTLYRGVHDSENKTAQEFIKQLRYGRMPLSAAMNSTKGRGIYASTAKFQAEMHMRKAKNGIVMELAADKSARTIEFNSLDEIIDTNKDLSFLKDRKKNRETNVDIIAVLSGTDIIVNGAVINFVDRGKLLWKKGKNI